MQQQQWRDVDLEAASDAAHTSYREHGVYVITGGLGGLGRIFAQDILDHSQHARVILTSTDGVRMRSILQAFASTRVSYQSLDLQDANAVSVFFAQQQPNGIIHCAGMVDDDFILNKTPQQLAKVFAPKVSAATHIVNAADSLDLDFMVFCSSVTAVLGNLGQADYAAANGFMDSLAAARQQRVLQGECRGFSVSINWPLWADGGMQVDAASIAQMRLSNGMQPLDRARGLLALHTVLQQQVLQQQGLQQQAQVFVMAGERKKIHASLRGGAASDTPTLAAHAHTSDSNTNVNSNADIDSNANVNSNADDNSNADLHEQTQAYLCQQMGDLLRMAAHNIDPKADLESYGINSILAMELTAKLEQTFGALSKTLFFEYLSVSELTDYFVTSHAQTLHTLFDTQRAAPAAATPAASTRVTPASLPVDADEQAKLVTHIDAIKRRFATQSTHTSTATRPINDEPIAIIGLSGRYPEAHNIDAYWDALRQGKDCITEVPASRWDWREYYTDDRTQPGKHFSKWGGFIEGVDEFDPRFFNISPREADTMDPQERLFLQHAWMAVEDAGYTRASLQIPHHDPDELNAQVGVYVGVMYGEYQLFGAEMSLRGERTGFSSNLASVANRVSYFLDLHGPSMTIDTMCSSSLSAIHIACQDLKQGQTQLAIAGGVNVSVHPNKYLMLSAGQFISGDGHCQSFGEGGDGYIPAEGVGAVVLKRLSEAQQDGNPIYGVIKGSALSHGGKTNGYTVPNPKAQASAIRQAVAAANVDTRQINYIEAHGTGTKLGDPIEISALSHVFTRHGFDAQTDTGYCLIGSAKSNIGHCESAAGIVSLTKVLLQMKHQQIVPSLHSTRLNPHIDFDNSPFVVNQSLQAWSQPRIDNRDMPRLAGISSWCGRCQRTYYYRRTPTTDICNASRCRGDDRAVSAY